jgi:hypothetical protein
VPVKEYPQFEAALSELAVLSPRRALELFRERVAALERLIAGARAELADLHWLPRLFVLEAEYHVAMREAELAWVRGLAAEFEGRTFPGLDGWQYVHDTGEWPPEFGAAPASWAGHADHTTQSPQDQHGDRTGRGDGATH